MQLVLPAGSLQPKVDTKTKMTPLGSSAGKPGFSSTLPYPPRKCLPHLFTPSITGGDSNDVARADRENCADPHRPPSALISTISAHQLLPQPTSTARSACPAVQMHTTGGTCRSSPTAPLPTSPSALQPSSCTPMGRSLPLRFWGWPRDARLGFPRCREETLEKLLPMASGPQGCFSGGQARLGRSRGKVCKCVRARGRAAGGGPWRGCGRGRAVRCLRFSLGLAVFARRVLPTAGILAPLGYRASMPRARGGRAPGPRAAARAAVFCLALELGFRLRVGGAAAARSPRAIESGLCARLLRRSAAGSIPARGDGRGDVRGALPPAGELAAPAPAGSLPRPSAPTPAPASPGLPGSGCYGDSCAGE